MVQKEFFIVAGANGSGKTTFAKEFMKLYNYEFINADEIAKELDPNNTTGGKLTAGRILFKRVAKKFEKNESFILESTLSGKYLFSLIKKAKDLEYKITIIYVFLDSTDSCINRIKQRVIKGGHFVPDEDVIRRYNRSKKNFWNEYRLLADHWSIHSNSNTNYPEVCTGNRQTYKIFNSTLFGSFLEGVI